jgi:hypothetical protein
VIMRRFGSFIAETSGSRLSRIVWSVGSDGGIW